MMYVYWRKAFHKSRSCHRSAQMVDKHNLHAACWPSLKYAIKTDRHSFLYLYYSRSPRIRTTDPIHLLQLISSAALYFVHLELVFFSQGNVLKQIQRSAQLNDLIHILFLMKHISLVFFIYIRETAVICMLLPLNDSAQRSSVNARLFCARSSWAFAGSTVHMNAKNWWSC